MIKKNIIALNREHLKNLIKQEMSQNGQECGLNHINVSKITDMTYVFSDLRFNGDISQWDVSGVECMQAMFYNSTFNGDISGWNVSKVDDMSDMFYFSKFKQDLSSWMPYNLENHKDMFKNCDAPQPYWIFYKNEDERNQAIKKYQLAQSLENNLIKNSGSVSKIKI